jgi:hypothetical protein
MALVDDGISSLAQLLAWLESASSKLASWQHQPLTYLRLFWALICSAKSSKCSSPEGADIGLWAAVSGFGITASAFGLNGGFKASFCRNRGEGEMAMAEESRFLWPLHRLNLGEPVHAVQLITCLVPRTS